jgi:hypothetical protein
MCLQPPLYWKLKPPHELVGYWYRHKGVESGIHNAPAPGVPFGIVVNMCGVNCYELGRLV